MVSVAASFNTPSPSKAFPKPSMPPTVAAYLPAKGAFALWGPCNSVVRLGRIIGCWTEIASNAAYHGWVYHASVTIRRRDWFHLTLASTFSIKQNGGNAYP